MPIRSARSADASKTVELPVGPEMLVESVSRPEDQPPPPLMPIKGPHPPDWEPAERLISHIDSDGSCQAALDAAARLLAIAIAGGSGLRSGEGADAAATIPQNTRDPIEHHENPRSGLAPDPARDGERCLASAESNHSAGQPVTELTLEQIEQFDHQRRAGSHNGQAWTETDPKSDPWPFSRDTPVEISEDAQGRVGHHDGGFVLHAPQDWTDGENSLSKLAHDVSLDGGDRCLAPAESTHSAGQPVSELTLEQIEQFDQSPRRTSSDIERGELETATRPAEVRNDPLPSNRAPVGTRASRGLPRFLMAACIGVVVTLAWQSCSGSVKQMIASWAVPRLARSSSLLAMSPPPAAGIAREQRSPPAVQASAPEAGPTRPAAVPPTPSSGMPTPPAARSSELQQIESMARDLAAVRRSIEQLAAGRDQTARNVRAQHHRGAKPHLPE
jgi:hypothetical protein